MYHTHSQSIISISHIKQTTHKYQPNDLFFSSRRRHTRSYGDWSSDVCSSDLELVVRTHELVADLARKGYEVVYIGRKGHPRSEERRVGKECRARGARA